MARQTTVGWILDVSKDSDSDSIVVLIKLQEVGRVISFKQKLHHRRSIIGSIICPEFVTRLISSHSWGIA
jgi:hypothetical protein